MSGIGQTGQSRESRIDLGKFSLVRYQTHGKRLEIIVNPHNAWLSRQGEEIPIEEIVEGFTVFENFSKGLKADITTLQDILGVVGEKEIISKILEKGELQITQEQRKQFLKEKRDEIIDFLVKHAVNPKTKSPHPAARIEKAMDDAGVQIDRKEPAPDQARKIIKEIQRIIPIQIETAKIECIVPPKDTGKLYGFIQGSGEVIKESWGKDGALTMIIQIPAGIVVKILEDLSDRSKGRVQATVIERAGN
ncbi:MAG: ribosome assembly factor SBDS [Candidatus Heimdallarchaeota archaeon]|nr:ribosome assembly factor SBDS [Candidatus Heimdallarchaeota archaeon]